MKKLISVLVALTLVFGLAVAAAAASPADNGWSSESEFSGWTLNSDGSMTLVYNDGTGANDNRILHDIPDAQNFTLTVKVDSETNSRPVIKMLGVMIELNAENGNGNQFFVKNFDGSNWNNFDWLTAQDCVVTVVLSRTNGGNLKVTVTGEGNDTPVTMDIAVPEPDSTSLELAMFGCGNHEKGGIATYTVTLPTVEEPDPSEPGNPSGGDPENPKTAEVASVGFAALAMVAAAAGLVITGKKKEY